MIYLNIIKKKKKKTPPEKKCLCKSSPILLVNSLKKKYTNCRYFDLKKILLDSFFLSFMVMEYGVVSTRNIIKWIFFCPLPKITINIMYIIWNSESWGGELGGRLKVLI